MALAALDLLAILPGIASSVRLAIAADDSPKSTPDLRLGTLA